MADRQLVVHGLAVKKLGTAKGVADLLGASESAVQKELDALVEEKQAIAARGAFMLTPPAQLALKDSYASAFADLRANAAMTRAYERFEIVNREFKGLVTDWQTMTVAGEQVPNDHSSPEWDAQCIDKLGRLHERFEPILKDMGKELSRLSAYEKRLEIALEKLEAGEQPYFSAPKIDSYHTVWFELHEDLLRMLGRTRDE